MASASGHIRQQRQMSPWLPTRPWRAGGLQTVCSTHKHLQFIDLFVFFFLAKASWNFYTAITFLHITQDFLRELGLLPAEAACPCEGVETVTYPCFVARQGMRGLYEEGTGPGFLPALDSRRRSALLLTFVGSAGFSALLKLHSWELLGGTSP